MPEAVRRRLRRNPCIGICSTTYGDLVCRGCKRFAHEVVGWNGFAGAQRHVVWTRLNRLLAESVRAYVTVVDEERLRSVCPGRIPDADALPVEVVAFRTMRARPLPMAALGLAVKEPSAGEREGAAPRMGEPSAGEREGPAPRMREPSAGEGEGPALRTESRGQESVEATRETARRIDREFYARSRAYYEASFKTLT